MTPLFKALRREISIGGKPYTMVVDPSGLKLMEKGHRKGIALRWADLVSGDVALAAALQGSLEDAAKTRRA